MKAQKKTEPSTLSGHVQELAQQLAGSGWRRKFPRDWTPDEKAAFESASEDEKAAWFEDILDTPGTDERIAYWAVAEDGAAVHYGFNRETGQFDRVLKRGEPDPDIARWEGERTR